MKTVMAVLCASVAAVVLSTPVGTASAAEIRVLSALGMKDVVDELAPRFEQKSGHTLAIKFGTLGSIVKMLQGGETADVVIIPKQGIETLVKDGKVGGGDVTVLASSGIVVVYRKGAAKPDVSTPDALKKALLAAKSITYSNPAEGGASGIHFEKVLDRLGIAKEMKPKTIYAKAGADTGMLVANGKVEFGINQLQVLMPVQGIEVAGPLPGDLQATTVFAAGIMSGSQNAAPSKAWVNFLRTPDAAKVIKAKGMDPS